MNARCLPPMGERLHRSPRLVRRALLALGLAVVSTVVALVVVQHSRPHPVVSALRPAGAVLSAARQPPTETSATASPAAVLATGATLPAKPARGCRAVPRTLVQVLRAGLALSAGGVLSPIRAVEARVPGRVYFVAARVHSDSLHGRSPLAVWAVSTLRADAVVYSVNSVAKALSDWRRADRARFTTKTPGAAAAARCIR